MIKKYILLNKVDANTGGGGATSDDKKEQENQTPSQEEGDSGFDENGYPIEKAKDDDGKKDPESGKESKEDGKKADEKPVQEQTQKVEGVTGYGVEEPKEEKSEEPPPQEEKKESQIKLEYEVDAKGLDFSEIETLKKFAQEHALPQKATQALIDARKSEIDTLNKQTEAYKKELENKKKETRSKWDKELRTDKEFGGENFAHNLHAIEKVLQDFMPEMKKELTDKGIALAPYIMKGLARVAKSLNAKETFVKGDKGGKENSDKDEASDPLAFYV